MKKYLLIMIILAFGCSYSVYTTGLPHLKTIRIQTFENKTDEYDLSEDLLNYLSDNFERDGRLKLVELEPDCILAGEILDYTEKIYTYKEEDIEEYEVKILFKVRFKDVNNNEDIWSNDALILKERYADDSEYTEINSEEEAQQEIFKELYETILRNTLEEW